ncbi:uncharacterized protein BJ171DRAFT_489506 [Polychytrium aggregatum]|uniref:uncharacterized protein n=1 Tax=Polychytrium aggregatum TaxID=110093 RepID=UPI0022FE45D7|nr:uncharacterized protein BJ171DRAFT_489506 [Polychytrium aggregatum]KAI9208606.1 hypothetical protein BJ171DRAFT_489506 [Polychytrium aggregatum]
MTQDWVCPECEQENTAEDPECIACGQAKAVSPYAGFQIGLVVATEAIPKTKLRQLKIKLTDEDLDLDDDSVDSSKLVTIVTNAKNVDKVGLKVVVATIGTTVTVDGEEVVVKKATVGGRKSEGMLCDGPMLRWKGGGAGAAVVLSGDEFVVGSEPPAARPRADAA